MPPSISVALVTSFAVDGGVPRAPWCPIARVVFVVGRRGRVGHGLTSFVWF